MESKNIDEPVPVWEAMTELNTRSIFGRIVINPPSRMAPIRAHKTGDSWYFCQTCGRGFLQQEKMMEHTKEHKKNVFFETKIKTKRKKKSQQIKSNRKRLQSGKDARVGSRRRDYSDCINTESGGYQCRICAEILYSSSRYLNHALTHQIERPHKCDLCGAGFKVAKYLEHHTKRSHSELHQFQCEKCVCRFESYIGLRNHTAMYHNANAFLSQDLNTDGAPVKQITKTPKRKRCSKTVAVASINEESESKTNSDIIAKPVFRKRNSKPKKLIFMKATANTNTVQAYNRHEVKNVVDSKSDQVLSGSQLQCEVCNKKLANPSTLRNHMLVHSGERPYLCKHCGIKFRLYSTLSNHIKISASHPLLDFRIYTLQSYPILASSAHFGTGTFNCSYCNCSYKTASVLGGHINKFHQDVNN